MIVLDTHIWIWWFDGDPRLPRGYREYLSHHQEENLGVSAISYWEVAKLVALGCLALSCDVEDWLRDALSHPGVQLLHLAPEIAIESTRLPGSFHRDPADQIIVATASINACPLVTMDQHILAYAHVETAP